MHLYFASSTGAFDFSFLPFMPHLMKIHKKVEHMRCFSDSRKNCQMVFLASSLF